VKRTVHAIGVSAYNTADLEAAGYPSVGVAPPLMDMATFDGVADPDAVARFRRRRGAQWLFVGRLAPNKAAHHLVLALAAYRRGFDPDARLVLIGGHGHRAYTNAIVGLIEELGLTDAVEMAGSVDHGTLAAAYETSDVFVCVSDHEGFCFPLLEAMHHRLPIVAYAEAAVPETVGYGGVLLEDKSPTTVAAAVHRVLAVEGRSKRLADAGQARLADFDLSTTRQQMLREVKKGLVIAELMEDDREEVGIS
jgi:glycosyltransferase involved in cell wall biosynthesis